MTTTNSAFNTTANVDRIVSILSEIDRQKKTKRDYIFGAKNLSMDNDGKITLSGKNSFRVGGVVYTEWKDAEAAADCTGETLEHLGETGAMSLNRTAERQLATRLDIPLRYIDELRKNSHGDLAAHNFTTLLGRSSDRFLVRTLDGNIRAIMSDRYRVLDNADVFFAAAETLQQASADIWSARLWDDGFEMLAVSKDITGEVKSQWAKENNRGHAWAYLGDKGKDANDDLRPKNFLPADIHNAAIRISNSETGCGGLNVSFGLLRQVCNNTMIVGKTISVVHIGKQHNGNDGLVYSDETQESESKTIWLKLRDSIRTAFDRPRFEAYIAKLNGLSEKIIEKPQVAVDNLVKEYQISEQRKDDILKNLFMNRDLSRFGLVQAITQTAHELDGEEASEIEVLGGKLVDLSEAKFGELVGV